MTSDSGPRVVSDGYLSREELRGKRILVVGLGISGRAVATVLADAGAEVFASDSEAGVASHPEVEVLRARGLQVETGGHRKATRWLANVDFVIPSPGVSPQSQLLGHAISDGVPIMSEIELASRFVRAPVIAVTGTNGKTTTSSMTGAMLASDGRRSVVCGNIGLPFISAAIADPDAEVFVVEVSSFQLTFCYAFHPQVAVVTNFAPDHLDWHGSMDAYRVAKARIAARQTRNDSFVYPAAQPELAELAPSPGPRRIPFSVSALPSGDGVWISGGRATARIASDVVAHLGSVDRLARRGRVFVEDGLAAAAATLAYGVGAEAVEEVLTTFDPDHHRLELVREANGIRFVDDSKATNPHATVSGLAGLERVVLICGGRNKGLDLSVLARSAASLRAVVCLGEAGPELISLFQKAGVQAVAASSMQEAVSAAYRLAQPADTVLLSPACASFDQFDDYAQRGRAFAEAVNALPDPEPKA